MRVKLTKLLTNANKGKLWEFEMVVEDLNNKLLDEEGKQKEIERREKIQQEVEPRLDTRKKRENLQGVKERKSLFCLSKKRSRR